jgi:dTDP-4-amino-4,6-dideoxygalactose transaminase
VKFVRPVPVTDPHATYVELEKPIQEAMARVLSSGRYILGPEVEAFEAEFASFIGVEHGVGVASGTDAIAIGLKALGIGRGDEVITVAHTAVATVAGIEQAGAMPVLVDVDEQYATMDAALLDRALTSRTRAVIPVHLYGQAADLDGISAFCARNSLALVEDASQAHGARLDGSRLGSVGHLGVFSCYPTKNLGALGDAGILVTRDPQVAERARRLREYGWAGRNWSLEPGVNSRLDEIQAAVLRVKLGQLDSHNDRRRSLAAAYALRLAGSSVSPFKVRPNSEHVFHLYVVRSDDRDALAARLAGVGIQTAVHYPHPLHLQPAYQDRVRIAGTLNVSEQLSRTILSLPMYPEMNPAWVAAVCSGIEGT